MKSRNQDFKAVPACSEQMESGPGALPDFKCWKEAVNSLSEKLSEIFTASGFVALQRSDTSWETSQDNLQSTASYFPFLTSWDAIVSAETGQWRGECRDLPVRLFKILHAFRLECEKSMLRTASDHQSLRFLPSLASRALAAKPESSPWGDCRKVYSGIYTTHPNTKYSYFDIRVGQSFWLLF